MSARKPTIATLGSHSALQILHGAKQEGFKTLAVTTNNRVDFYRRFKFIDEVIGISSFDQFPTLEKQLSKKNIIMIPHGSFVAYLGLDINKRLKLPYYGNKSVLDWEADRGMQRTWLKEANINVPRQFKPRGEKITYPVIVKSYGAAGGHGYFYARDEHDLRTGLIVMKGKKYVIQQYIIGVPLYIHYFYSPITKQLEIMSIDKRYETNVDSLGRIPSRGQKGLGIEASYVVVGNSPLVLRESLLPEAFAMGERIIEASKKLIDKKGLFGPFCIETVITPDQKFYAIELSCRIVAGSNLFTHGSAYSWFNYDVPMSTGRRIAKQINDAIKKNKMKLILD